MKSISTSALTAGVLLIALSGAVTAAEPLVVKTPDGRLAGRTTEGGADAWLGVPYAAPPIGERRWQPPAPVVPWIGVRAATAMGSPCTQATTDASGAQRVVGSEDCLTLNIVRPPHRTNTPLPVMLWIHGGGQAYGTGATYDGTRLALSQSVIVVTINYRLGPFGWFHHPAITGEGRARSTGQFGLLDAIAALRWVRANIAAFGGDPHRVTVFGESAGAQNVYALLLAPKARGLFQGAIAESGGFWNMSLEQAVNDADAKVPGTPLSAREVVSHLLIGEGRATTLDEARALQSAEPPTKLAAWLRSLPAAAVLAPYLAASHADYDLPSVVYDGVLLPRADHRTLFTQGRYHHVPLLIGSNRDEERMFLAHDPVFVRENAGTRQIIDPRRYAAFDRLYSDFWTTRAVDELLPLLTTPLYAYRFEWDDEPRAPTDVRALVGAGHGMELPFVFGDFRWALVHDELPVDDAVESTSTDPYRRLFTADTAAARERLSRAMMDYWGEFARTGRPGRGTHHDLPVWPDWASRHEKQVFGSDGIGRDATLMDGETLDRQLWGSPVLTDEEKCRVFLEDAMYPHYPRDALTAHHCRFP